MKKQQPAPSPQLDIFNEALKSPAFPADYKSIIERLENIKPLQYAGSRNFVHGAVTYLSPYISRGVISLKQVMQHVLKKYQPYQVEKFLQELAWREYWQRIWQSLGDGIFKDIKQEQPGVLHWQMTGAIENGNTGIEAVDQHIHLLYDTGYMHNHIRMYVSSIACNIGGAHWLQPSQWMYYHLLDGDLASNSLSWQWVAGAFSSKKYYCNQENINRYTGSQQRNTFLDQSYEMITAMKIPAVLETNHHFSAVTNLPVTTALLLTADWPVIVYNSYNLDPAWHAGENVNRVLLLEPVHFKKYPVSDRVINFILHLSHNIDGIQIFTGDFDELHKITGNRPISFKSHPTCNHYKGTAEKYEEMFPDVSGYYSSFFSYWKKCRVFIE